MLQRHVIRGQIIGLEGKDATKHVRIAEYGTGRELRGDFRDIQLASVLAAHLWGDVVELSGTARLMRHPDGIWELKTFRIDHVQELESGAPSEFVRKSEAGARRQRAWRGSDRHRQEAARVSGR